MFGTYIVFVLFETILSRSFCVRLHDLHKRIQTFEGCIFNVWKCIHNEGIQVRNYISVLALEGGWGQGSITEGVVLNRKCRTTEYSLNARLFTPVGFDELVETLLSGWIANKVYILTQISKRSFGKNTVYQNFSPWEAGLQGAVCQPQKSLTMVALAARYHLIRLVSLYQNCNFYHNQLPGFLRDDNNRI